MISIRFFELFNKEYKIKYALLPLSSLFSLLSVKEDLKN